MDPNLESLDAAAACVRYIRGYCERLARCEGITVDSCMISAERCPDLLFSPGSSRNVAETPACGEAWSSWPCGEDAPPCATPGTRELGEACVASMQCASGSCTSDFETCGVCEQRAAVDETPNVEESTSLALGEECDPESPRCGIHRCGRQEEGTYRCVLYPTLGEDCSEPLTCMGDSYCDISQVCLPLPEADEPCGVDAFTGMSLWCSGQARCDRMLEPALCVDFPGVNEPCTSFCDMGLACLCTDETCASRACKRQRYPGDTCDASEDACVVSACTAGVCVGRPSELFDRVCAGE